MKLKYPKDHIYKAGEWVGFINNITQEFYLVYSIVSILAKESHDICAKATINAYWTKRNENHIWKKYISKEQIELGLGDEYQVPENLQLLLCLI